MRLSPSHRHRRFRVARRPRGFTLIELLVVIAIIVILLGILIPVIGKVREKAYAASTNAEIAALSAVFTQYHGDWHAYPGIVPNGQLRQMECNINGPAGWDLTRMSMNENVFLSLCGGLKPVKGSNPPSFQLDSQQFGAGAQSLGPKPGKLKPYTDMNDVKINADGWGKYTDSDGTPAADSMVPEFVDRFPDRMPLLILRARTGAPGVCTQDNQPPYEQYDLEQIKSYTDNSAVSSTPIGVGRKISQSEYTGGAIYPHHGLGGDGSVNPSACIAPPNPNPLGLQKVYPYDLYAALIDPNITRQAAPATPPTNSPRQKDQYIIISAGIDRVYGTADDITNFGSW